MLAIGVGTIAPGAILLLEAFFGRETGTRRVRHRECYGEEVR
jgi:hypothetical protein